MAKDAFSKRMKLLTRGMSTAVKKRIVRALIWSVALDSAETWSQRKEDNGKLEDFEMCYVVEWRGLVGHRR